MLRGGAPLRLEIRVRHMPRRRHLAVQQAEVRRAASEARGWPARRWRGRGIAPTLRGVNVVVVVEQRTTTTATTATTAQESGRGRGCLAAVGRPLHRPQLWPRRRRRRVSTATGRLQAGVSRAQWCPAGEPRGRAVRGHCQRGAVGHVRLHGRFKLFADQRSASQPADIRAGFPSADVRTTDSPDLGERASAASPTHRVSKLFKIVNWFLFY